MKIRGLNRKEQSKFTHFFSSKNEAPRRKGQEVVSNFGIVGIVGIIFLVVVVLGIWYVSTRTTQASTQIPANAEIIAQACSSLATESTVNSYCLQFRQINTNVYATCDHVADYNIVVTDSDGTSVAINAMNERCKQFFPQLTAAIQQACSTGDYKGKPNVEINKKKCSEYIIGATCAVNTLVTPKVCSGLKYADCTALSYCAYTPDTAAPTDTTKGSCAQKPACNTLDSNVCGSRSDCSIVYK